MHMNTAPHLRPEDRPEFERVLDEALRAVRDRPEPAAGRRLNTEQLRAAAVGATAAIAACAAAEYEHFVALRDELRLPGHAPSSQGPARGAAASAPRDSGSGTGPGGAGLLATLSVLAPVLAGTAALIFLLTGHLLRVLDPEPSIAAQLRDAGWVFAALTAASLLAACVGLLVTAVRHGAGTIRAGGPSGQSALAEEVARARTAWRTALLERGVLPFLHEALAAPASGAGPASQTAGTLETSGAPGAGKARRESRHPRLGYTHPGFSSPGGETSRDTGAGARFTSPDFTSPDFGGPEHPLDRYPDRAPD
ncbi:membrane protein [Streptomyces chitinivorans]|nr:hypothetical protein [Streptomyces chitinivorans]MDH2408219.1 hypothetical protein [Streptomyces chitinivorans]